MKKKDQIQTIVRVRPLLQSYEDKQAWQVYNNSIFSTDKNNKTYDFTFPLVKNSNCQSEQIYNQHCQQIIYNSFEGYNTCILCYGQTTSGKTYTMLGTPQNAGILPCSLRDIFLYQEENQEKHIKIYISYLEIYNEQIHDLINVQNKDCKIVDHSKWGIFVQNLTFKKVSSFQEAIGLMNQGEDNRIYRETNIHDHSSRSHTIFKIYLEIEDFQQQTKRFSCINLVDLAGSEKIKENNNLNRQQEGENGYINKSLFTLTNVINKLAEKNKHIPYRDSKLTRLLQQSLGGNSKSLMIFCVSPASCNFNQTLSTLKFAQRAKDVSLFAFQNNEIEEVKENLDVAAVQIQDTNQINELQVNIQQQQLELKNNEYEIKQLKNELFNKDLQIDKMKQLNQELKYNDNELKQLRNELFTKDLQIDKMNQLNSELEFNDKELDISLKELRNELYNKDLEINSLNQKLKDQVNYEAQIFNLQGQLDQFFIDHNKETQFYKNKIKQQEDNIQQLNELNKQNIDQMEKNKKYQSRKSLNKEINFIDQVVFYLKPIINVLNNQSYYQFKEKSQNIQNYYKVEMLKIQNNCRNQLKEVLKNVTNFQMLQKVFQFLSEVENQDDYLIQKIEKIENNEAFEDLNYKQNQNMFIIQLEQINQANTNILQNGFQKKKEFFKKTEFEKQIQLEHDELIFSLKDQFQQQIQKYKLISQRNKENII